MALSDRVAVSDEVVVDARAGHVGSRIDLDDVSRTYRVGDTTVTALEGVNLHVDEAAFVVILGPSGSGKTTLLNVIGALDRPTAGTVRVAGIDLTRASSVNERQVPALGRQLRVPELQPVPGLDGDRERAVRRRCRADDLTLPSGLATRSSGSVWSSDCDHFPHQLSGGEQQRVAIARALATGNPIMLADEPTGELDFTTGVQILRVLEEQARAGLSVLVVTHNREISRVADRVIELSSGHIIADGPPAGGRADLSELQW